MRNFANIFEELILHRGLYRVWVDPAMGAFESRGEKKTCDRALAQAHLSGPKEPSGDEAEVQDDGTRWTVSS